jgi:WD40 repeat protein
VTVWQIYTSEVPLGYIDPGEFTQLVARDDLRPERPFDDEAPQLIDAVWHLAETCWAKSFAERPSANAVCDTLSSLLDTATFPSLLPEASAISASRLSPKASFTPPITVSLPLQHHQPDNAQSPSQLSQLSLVQAHSSRTQFLRLVGHTGSIWSVAFSPDGKRVVSGSLDKTHRVWDSQTGKALVQTVPQAENVYSVCFSADGQSILTLGIHIICVCDADTGRVTSGPFHQHNVVWDGIFSPANPKLIVFGSSDGTTHAIDALTGHPLCAPFTGHSAKVYCVAVSLDGKGLVSGSADKTIRIWDTATRKVIIGHGHADAIYSVAFSPDGMRVASGSKDNSIILWDAGTARVLWGPYAGHTDFIYRVAFSPDGQSIASGSRDTTIRIWDATTGSLVVSPLMWHTGRVYSVAFSPDGERIVSGSGDKTVCIGYWRGF